MSVQTLHKPGIAGSPPPASVAQTPPAPFLPKMPTSFAEAGLDTGIVESLILKYLAGTGSASGGRIAHELCLPPEPLIEVLTELKQQQIVVYVGSASMSDFTYTLTDAGRDRARRYMIESMYVGPAPVPIGQYVAAVGAQTIANSHPCEQDLRTAFSDLLISQEMFETLGPAINSGRGMFLYGFAGNGKSSIAERITKCFGDEIYIPKCLISDGFIIKLYDEANHVPAKTAAETIFKTDKPDPRWIRIKRPTIVAGGELMMNSLEINFNTTSKTCQAPIQLKSNCGTLVIDDFGRQRMAPIELLNRWIVPLEKRFDFLNLPNGKKLQMPFDQLIIFATNIEPKDLCDDAFLRRIPYKINIGDPTEAQFRQLFEFVAPRMGFEIDVPARKAIDHLVETHYKAAQRPFRNCQPRDLMLQVKNRCLYKGSKPALTAELFDYAASVYFTVM